MCEEFAERLWECETTVKDHQSNGIRSVTTVIVTYNSADLFKEEPNAVPRADWIETVFVDNDSRDSTVQVLATTYPDAEVIENDTNAGFSKAVNLGANGATGDYILLLNPDAAISSEALLSLTRAAEENDLAISAPVVRDGSERFATVAAGWSPTTWKMFTHATGLSRFGHRLPVLRGHYIFGRDLVDSGVQQLDWVSGGCMLIRADAWHSLGGLTDRWFMYAEDIEFCLRARKSGYRVGVACGVTARHEIGQSSSGVDGQVNPAWIVNLYELYRWRIARSTAASRLWKFVVVGGFEARVLVYRLLSAVQGRSGERSANINRFRVYATELRRQPSELIHADEASANATAV